MSDMKMDEMAAELREAYGLPHEAVILMRPDDLIAWKQRRLLIKKARDENLYALFCSVMEHRGYTMLGDDAAQRSATIEALRVVFATGLVEGK